MSARERLAEAALALFEEAGFDATTVDDVAERAGVGRSTFFRHFRCKEEAVLPDHAELVAQVEERLRHFADDLPTRITEAARIVFDHYLAEGERARARYRLISSVPAVQAREVAVQRAYERTFLAAIHQELGGTRTSRLEAALVANAVVTAHNHVLRDWLRGDSDKPNEDFDRAMARATAALRPVHPGQAPEHVAVEAARHAVPLLEQLLPAVRDLAGVEDSTRTDPT